ncbi:hypothetical protein CYY_006827 [Polysphondylium violaceum]|uniref:Uncharacterized protein n=1 Tax=Polysphondylium violaceum TaxID=133409 RepID=A0A8J4PPI7_9MYCE|nr:hypothetical protein CYY_006827 [Polysphondylium violaceum]
MFPPLQNNSASTKEEGIHRSWSKIQELSIEISVLADKMAKGELEDHEKENIKKRVRQLTNDLQTHVKIVSLNSNFNLYPTVNDNK